MKTKSIIMIAASIGLIGAANAEEGKKRHGRKIPPQILAEFDTDGDGTLNEEERAAAKAAHGERMKARKAEMLEKFDKDGDGELNEEEKKAMNEAMKARMLEKFDKDGDGELSAEERAEMRKAMSKRRGGPRHGARRKGPRDGKGKPEPQGGGEAPGVTE